MGIIKDAHGTVITFASNNAVKMEPFQTTPPGVDGGAALPATTHENTAVHTDCPQILYRITEGGLQVYFDPAVLPEILALVNQNQAITVTFKDGSTWTFWGWLRTFVPDPFVSGQRATATVAISISNLNNADPQVETAPAYAAAP